MWLSLVLSCLNGSSEHSAGHSNFYSPSADPACPFKLRGTGNCVVGRPPFQRTDDSVPLQYKISQVIASAINRALFDWQALADFMIMSTIRNDLGLTSWNDPSASERNDTAQQNG